MVAEPNPPLMTVAEYLDYERTSQIKHEYLGGRLYAMAGGSRAHGVIAVNILSLLRSHLRGSPCRVYSHDVKLQITEEHYVYPDASVGCDTRDRANDGREDVVRYPKLAVEVLSPSTEAYDRGGKFAIYREKNTLREYVLVAGDRQVVEVFRRDTDGLWTLHPFGPADHLTLESIGFNCPVASFYEDVDL
ncbi:MAG: Uma2 family endonuclease [Chloroflexota bacterium]